MVWFSALVSSIGGRFLAERIALWGGSPVQMLVNAVLADSLAHQEPRRQGKPMWHFGHELERIGCTAYPWLVARGIPDPGLGVRWKPPQLWRNGAYMHIVAMSGQLRPQP